MLESTEKGEVRKTVGNYRLILMNDPNLQGAFRLNMFTDKIDITRDLGWYRESDSLTDVDLKFLVVYLEKQFHNMGWQGEDTLCTASFLRGRGQ